MSLLSRIAVEAARGFGMLASTGSPTNVSASYLVVAGGGGGGASSSTAGSTGGAGGGGAGGFLASTVTLSTLNTYSITVGAGGNGSTSQSATGSSGSNSVLSGTGLSTITSTGGGGGGSVTTSSARNGLAGGSGGGGGATAGVNGTGGSGTSGQGSAGGNGLTDGVTYDNGGGGGGASAVGSNATSAAGGNGGAGTSSSISGSSVTYAGGGGGSAYPLKTQGTGGAGGGGNSGSAGTANRGGGGGGGIGSGNAGGSGIVIISYTSATPKFVGGTITTSGGKQIHTFTSSGTLSPITPITASYLVVAGGGGGAAHSGAVRGGGGGGAGGYLESTTTLYSGATYIVTVGAGGTGAGDDTATNGSNSVLSGTGLTTLTSVGGGAGRLAANGASGGSGGGGGYTTNTGGAGTSGQGYAGGNGGTVTGSASDAGGGGGGAGGIGGNGSSSGSGSGGTGGSGVASSITGTSISRAGGGGGGNGNGNGGTATAGGGTGGSVGGAGTPNTGGGGGGKGTGTGGNGGSGVVIISYAGSQVFNGGLVTTSGGNTIHTFTSTGALTPLTNNLNNSLRFRSSASAYLNRTPTVAGNRQTFTYSGWVKRGALGSVQTLLSVGVTTASNPRVDWQFNASNSLEIDMNSSGTSWDCLLTTTQVFRDPSAWYHIVVAVDTTQATTANRVKLYVNGNQVTSFSSSTYPAQNASMPINNTLPHALGGYIVGASQYVDGYMTDINFIDGQALEPYYFGNNDANGVWKPIQYKGTYGTNGFYLTFGNTTSTTTLGYDSSPNGNNWTCNNISLTAGTTYDAMTDVPTNTSATVANYAVLNPTIANTTNLINANLTRNGAVRTNVASMVCTNGKYYFETTIQDSNGNGGVGVKQTTAYPLEGYDTSKCAAYFSNGEYKIEGGAQTSGFSTYTNGDVIGIAIDTTLSTPKIWFAKNNTWQGTGDPTTAGYSLTSGLDYYFAILHTSSASSTTASANFGQRPFAYTPPTGYVALNTYNLPTPTILQGNKYMDATTYTGTGTTNVVVNQAQFKPDFVWIKARNDAQYHVLQNSNTGAGKTLFSNTTGAETGNTGDFISSFNSNGFTVNTTYLGGTNDTVDKLSNTYVGWQWQAGQGSTSSNTSGSITSTVSVSTTAGFSVVTYTGNGTNQGATVGHGLGVTPAMVIVKSRVTAPGNWSVWHKSFASQTQGVLSLNLTDAYGTDAYIWGNTAPSSTSFGVGVLSTGNYSNKSGNNYVAYCWAEIAQFSKFGNYTGNGSTDGPFVYTGFRPKFVMLKRTDTTGNWIIYDSSRNTYNVVDLRLIPNTSDAEATVTTLDFLSNGFKLRTSDIDRNASGGTYIYAAFAENPFKNSNAR